jgi:ParB family chromosome partitioning protein
MLRLFKKLFGRGTNIPRFQQVKIHKIVIGRFSPRYFVDDEYFQALKKSIGYYGILVPLILAKQAKYYLLVCGRRRFEAAKQLGFKRVPAIVRKMSYVEILETSLLENLHRKDFTKLDIYYGLERLKKVYNDLSLENIASSVGLEPEEIVEASELTKLSCIIQDAIRLGKIDNEQAKIISDVSNPRMLSELIEIIYINKLSLEDTKALTDRILRREPAYITAEGSVHFHSTSCPFALLIPEEKKKKLYSRSEAKKLGKISCMYCL